MNGEWYLAELVMKITVAGESRTVVHQNLVLVSALSPDEAYAKALKFGKDGQASYDNPDGKAVEITFEGISGLVQLYEELQDGAELTFREKIGLDREQIRTLIPPRDQLPVFRPPQRTKGPDYTSGEIVAELDKAGFKLPD